MAYLIAPDDPDSDLYKVWHTRGLGASAAEVVMYGKNKYRETEYDLWTYITHRKEKPPQTAPMLAGLEAEPKICAGWEAASMQTGEPVNIIDAEHNFLRAQIDWLCWDDDLAVDFKYSYGFKTYDNAVRYNKGTNILLQGTKDFEGWWIAAQHQLMLLGFGLIHYYIWKDEHRPAVDLIVMRDDDYIACYRKKAIDWWTSYCVLDLPPPKGRKLTLKMDKE